jgi:serine protease
MRGGLGVVGAWAFLLPALAAPAPAAAKATPVQTCQSSQLRAAGRLLRAELQCWAAWHKNPDADPGAATLLPACRDDAEETFRGAYASSLAAAGPNVCSLDEDVEGVLDGLQTRADGLVEDISGDFVGTEKEERTLHAALLNATGNALASVLGAESKDAKKGDEPKRLAARSKARAKLLSAFSKALLGGPAYSGLAPDSVADAVEEIADELAALTAPDSFSVSGTVTAADGSFADSDVNDPNTTPVSNDTPGSAQEIPVPAALGGYVNVAGAGPTGNSQDAGDPSDFFRVSLAAGQRINLRFADPQQADLDLCLYDAVGTPLGCSEGLSETEELFAPSTGEFLVEVLAFPLCGCGSSYVLTLGQTLASAGPNGVRLSDEFVPGEVIVTLAPEAAHLGASLPAAASSFEASFGLEALGGASDREMLFRLPTAGAARAAAFQTLGAEPARAAMHARHAGLSAEERAKLDTLLAMKALHRRKDVARVEPNYIRRAQLTPNDEFFGLQWHYPLINLPAAWDLETGDTTVEVAVIDTGALFDHPDLAGGQLSSAFDFDFVSDNSRSLDGGGIDSNAEDPGDGAGVQPSSFHGTHVAGTIGASTGNASGVAGVAHAVTLIPLRALGLFGSGTSYDIMQAVRYAAGLDNDSPTSHLVDVINLSLGGTSFSSIEQDVYEDARNAGVIVIAAAGNSNSSQPFYPASYTGVVSVSAVDLRRQKAPYSNFGNAVDVAAPGGDTSVDRNGDGYPDGVLSTLKDEATDSFVFAFYQGTSMAAPHVAGVAALMEAAHPTLTPAEFDTLLSDGALTTDLGAGGRDDVFGYGLIDARKAVDAVDDAGPSDPILLVSPTSLNLGTSLTQASFVVSNGGGGDLMVSSVTETEDWLSVSPSSGLGNYTVTVDRDGLADGTYTGIIEVESSAGSATVSVVMAVHSGTASPDAGFHYVLVVDPDTFDSVAQFDVAAVDGAYPYAFGAVPSGTYLLFAGSDTDNDFFICGTGEACGAYPTLGTPELIEVDGDLSGLDFITGFLQTLGSGAASAGDGPPPEGLRRLRGRRLAR